MWVATAPAPASPRRGERRTTRHASPCVPCPEADRAPGAPPHPGHGRLHDIAFQVAVLVVALDCAEVELDPRVAVFPPAAIPEAARETGVHAGERRVV